MDDEDLKDCRFRKYANVDRMVISSPFVKGSGFKYLDHLRLKYHLVLENCPLKDAELKYLRSQKDLVKIRFLAINELEGWGFDAV